MPSASEGSRLPVDLSIVIPAFNEAPNLEPLLNRLLPVLQQTGMSWEVIFVDDGSRDGTLAMLRAAHDRDARIKALSLSRNFGKESALSAGLQFARGKAIVPMDADLQHPPEMIEPLVAEWRKGAQVVAAVRTSRRADGPVRRLGSRLFYRIFNALSDIRIIDGGGDFRLLDRSVVDILNRLPERARFLKGLYAWVGFRQTTIPYEVDPRHHGKTSFGFLRLLRYSLDALTSFSTFPLRIWWQFGGALIVVSLLYAAFVVINVVANGRDVPGFASLLILIALFGGLQCVTLGIMGEYIGRIMVEVKGRPLFIVGEALGLGPDEDTDLRIFEPQEGSSAADRLEQGVR